MIETRENKELIRKNDQGGPGPWLIGVDLLRVVMVCVGAIIFDTVCSLFALATVCSLLRGRPGGLLAVLSMASSGWWGMGGLGFLTTFLMRES